MSREKEVAKILNGAGIQAKVTDLYLDESDANVDVVGTNLYLQVGDHYIIIGRTLPPERGVGFSVQCLQTTSFLNLVNDVRFQLASPTVKIG